MKTIAVITSSRAEFGLLMPVIKKLKKLESKDFLIEVVVTGTHLSHEFGYTVEDIIKNDINIDVEIKIPLDSESPIDISHNQAITLEKFTELFMQKKYDGIVILGDRYEMLSIAIAAGNTQTPIFHLCGGDTTEGAIDEWIRHSITKMSYIHFPTNYESYNRIIQLGESPDRVFNFGSTSIDNIIESANMDVDFALNSLGLNNCSYAICTYHPVTMEKSNVQKVVYEFLDAIEQFPEIQFIVTKSNADQGGNEINAILEKNEKKIENLHVFSSLGVKRYLSLMKNCEFVLGNSSSGIIEAPAFKVPTVNIGNRQRGRLQSKSIINCGEEASSIVLAIKTALSVEFRMVCAKVESPYGKGDSAEKISRKIYDIILNKEIDLRKKFYNSGEKK